MSCRLWQMLILIILQLKIKLMAFDYLQSKSCHERLSFIRSFSCIDCFYEKRVNTSLHGYNELHHRWISDYDCFTRCLKIDSEKCRSFEYWHHNHQGLCVRANISLTDRPSAIGRNQFVDYYEINCHEDSQGYFSSSLSPVRIFYVLF